MINASSHDESNLEFGSNSGKNILLELQLAPRCFAQNYNLTSISYADLKWGGAE